jgi:DNA repair protein RecN (Recombination protein N)
MGGKASADLVRHGADKAVVSCVFESTPAADAILEENGIDAAGSEIILRREIASGGKGRAFVNNQPATVQVLKQLAPELALVHAQAESLSSFDSTQQRLLLDRFGGISTEAVSEAYAGWTEARDKLRDLLEGEQERLRMVDLWSYQRKEIEQAHLEPGEDEKLETEKRVLANAEKLYAAATGAFEELYEGGSSAETSLRAAQLHVEELARYDASFAASARDLASARATLSDIATTLRDYAESIDASPDRLAELEDRLVIIDRLKRKYGQGIAEVIAFGEDAARKLAEVEDRDGLIKALRAAVNQETEKYQKAARALSAERCAAAARLAKLAEAQINSLAMKCRFAVSVVSAGESGKGNGALAHETDSAWSSQGWDTVEYRIATNPGEPMLPLIEIASGGELSRVLLALKVAVEESAAKSKRTTTPRTLVFDEIDIGIGGRAAEAVGQKLKALGRAQQVLCVTHLPQIAAFADQHLAVEKHEKDGRTHTRIRVLDDEARKQEVARMLSGAKVTETSLQHAAQMIATSR